MSSASIIVLILAFVAVVILTTVTLLVLRPRLAPRAVVGRSPRRRASNEPRLAARTAVERTARKRADEDHERHPDVVLFVRDIDNPSDEAIGVTRRAFLNRSLFATIAITFAGGASAVIAYIWPTPNAGFGGKIVAGALPSILSYISTNQQPFYVPEARSYIVAYPAADLPAARASKAYPDYILANMEQGIVALYQRCVHLGCRVPFCQSSQWFECPCHGSKYNRVGEKKDGPAPRGLDRFQAIISGASVTINTGLLAVGPPIGTNSTGQVADGPHCVG